MGRCCGAVTVRSARGDAKVRGEGFRSMEATRCGGGLTPSGVGTESKVEGRKSVTQGPLRLRVLVVFRPAFPTPRRLKAELKTGCHSVETALCRSVFSRRVGRLWQGWRSHLLTVPPVRSPVFRRPFLLSKFNPPGRHRMPVFPVERAFSASGLCFGHFLGLAPQARVGAGRWPAGRGGNVESRCLGCFPS